ncbi:MAG TPA: DUF2279 domain-containing protein [Polyangia bacterium]|jgi:hypothetical protein
MNCRLASAIVLVMLAVRPASADPVPEPAPEPAPPRHRAAAALALGGAYVTWGVAEWLVLYRDKPRLPFTTGDEGWFSDRSYAGGADKFGHFWANLAYGRIGTEVLRAGGWDALPASALGAGLSFTFFSLVEVKDGLFHVFSYSDLTADAVGALVGMVMDNSPALDDALDVRVQWFPSKQYRRPGNTTFFVEDYSGQSYLLALKPRALRAVREGRWSVRWLELINPVIGFQSRGYKPPPPPPETQPRKQELFLGLTIDLQALSDELLGGATSRPGRWGHKVAHTLTEYVNAPFTTLQAEIASRSPDPQ